MSGLPAIVANIYKPRAVEVARRLVEVFRKQKVRPLLEADLAQALDSGDLAVPAAEIGRRAGIVLSLGGDGTILRSAQIIFPAVIPVLGLNLGKLGFLAHSAEETLDKVVGRVLDGELRVEDRLVLEARIDEPGDEKRFALNEFVIHHGITTRAIQVDLSVDGRRTRHFHADGVIVATPTGSTAYALAAGGPVVEPTVEAMVIVPVCPHSLTERPVVVSLSHTVGLTLVRNSEAVHLVADGQSLQPLATGRQVVVGPAPFPFRLASIDDKDYFSVLREKMGWGDGDAHF